MRVGKGVPLPSVLESSGLTCVTLYIPTDDEGMYIQALAGAFSQMGKWTHWVKDGTNRAAIAAEIWRDAIDYTYENAWLDSCSDCELCDMTKEELIEIIMEVLDMNINVNCGCGCGCGCGQGGNEPNEDYQTPLPSPGYSPNPATPEGQEWKCSMANYLMYVLRLQAIKSVTWDGTFSEWTEGWDNYFSFWSDGNYETFFYYPYTAILALINGVRSVQVVTDPFDVIYNDLVCAIHSSATPKGASDAVMGILNSGFTDLVVRSLMTEIASQLPWDMPFIPGSQQQIPAGFQGRDCDGCSGQGSDWPSNTEEYEWRVGSLVSVDQDSVWTSSREVYPDGVRWNFAITSSGETWSEQVEFTAPILDVGEEIVGYTEFIVSTESSGGIQDPNNGTVRVNGLSVPGPYRRLWYTAGNQAIEGLGSFDESNQENIAGLVPTRSVGTYARIGVSGTPPGSGVAVVSAVLWCVKLS